MAWAPAAIQAGGAILGGAMGGKKSGGVKVPTWLKDSTKQLGSFGQQLGQTPYQAYTGERVAGFSPDTLAAFDMIRNNVGAATPAYQSAMTGAQNLMGYQAPTIGSTNVSAQQINPSLIGQNFGYQSVNPQNVSTNFGFQSVDPYKVNESFTNQNVQTQFDPRTASANLWAGNSLDPYMNPYTDAVINAQMADQQNAYGQAYNQMASQAQAAGAFGGSRFGVAQGQLAADSVRNQALMSAQLRSQGFDTAAGLLSNDVNRLNQFGLANQAAAITADQMGLQGQMSNQAANLQAQNMGLNASLANQGAAMQASLANQGADLQAQGMGFQGQLANQSAAMQSALANQGADLQSQGMGLNAALANQGATMQSLLANQGTNLQAQGMNQDAAMRAALANQSASLASAGIQGNAASQLGWLGGQYANYLGNDASALGGIGSAQQALSQQQMDVDYGDYWDQTRQYPSQQMNWWSQGLQPRISTLGAQQPSQGGGLLGTLGGAQIGSQLGSGIYDWWKGMQTPNPYANGGSYDRQPWDI